MSPKDIKFSHIIRERKVTLVPISNRLWRFHIRVVIQELKYSRESMIRMEVLNYSRASDFWLNYRLNGV
jgi:hypothetical protein